MKKVLWICVIANLANAFIFQNFITLAYIGALLLTIVVYGKNDIKVAKILTIVTAIVGIILSVITEINIITIITSIALILSVIQDGFLKENQRKYDQTFGNNIIKERPKEEIKIVTKFDIDVVKDAFDNYVSSYDRSNYMIEEKYNHSINVADNAMNIASTLGLDAEGRYLAYVIGILHDIGRFEQIKEYNTMEDESSVDHGYSGRQLLEDGLLRQFVHHNKYDNIIFKAVGNHNKFKINDEFSEDEKLYCAIIRDADKLDLFTTLSEGEFKDYYIVNKDMALSSTIINEIAKKRPIDYSIINNNLDLVILRLAMVYDVNYPYTLRMIRQNDYLIKYVMLIDTLDSNKVLFKKIIDEIYADIDNKLRK